VAVADQDTELPGKVLTLAFVMVVSELVVCWFGVHRLGGGWLAVLVSVAVAALVEWPLLLAHELAHAAASVAVRIPVTGIAVSAGRRTRTRTWAGIAVRLGMTAGGESQVGIDKSPDRRLLRLRMPVVYLAGPVADLGLGLLFALGAWSAGLPMLVRATFVGASAIAFVRALAGPFAPPARYDGWVAVRWIIQPDRMRRILRDQQVNQAAEQAWRAGEPVDRPALATVLDSPDPALAAYAAIALLGTANREQRAELVTDLARLRALAAARGVPRTTATELLVRILDGLVDRFRPPGLARDVRDRAATDTVEIAEALRALNPARVEWRTALALAYLYHEQPEAARDVLRAADLDGAPPTARANPLAVSAMVEIWLGDLDAAQRLIRDAAAADPDAGWVGVVERMVARRVG
jgi:hypothetical protein